MVGTILWHNCWMLKILTYTYSSGILSSLAQTNFHFEVVSCNFRICHYLYFQRDQLAIIQQLKWLWNMTQLGMKPHNSTNAYNFETRTDMFHVYPWSWDTIAMQSSRIIKIFSPRLVWGTNVTIIFSREKNVFICRKINYICI